MNFGFEYKFLRRPSITVILFFLLMVINGCSSHNDDRIEEVSGKVNSYTQELGTILSSLEDIPDDMTFPLGNTEYREIDLKNVMRMIVANDEEIFGTTCAFEPHKFNKENFFFAPYFYEHGDSIIYKDLGNKDYDYFSWNWYQIPKRLGKSYWSEPYFDDGGGDTNLITYAAPIYVINDNSKNFVGVITVDISLDWINRIIESIKLRNGNFALLVSKLGTVISTDENNRDWRLSQTIFSLAEEKQWQGFREIGKKIIVGENGSGYFTLPDGQKYLAVYRPVKESDWSLLIAEKINDN